MARTAIVWPDACPVYMPAADRIIVLRDELSNSPAAEDPREVGSVEWADIEPVVGAFPYDEQLGCFRLEYDQPVSAVSEFVRSLPLDPHDPDLGLANDRVLNAELVAESRRTGS